MNLQLTMHIFKPMQRSSISANAELVQVQVLELEVDVVDDVLASCAIPGKGRNTSTKLSSLVVCMNYW